MNTDKLVDLLVCIAATALVAWGAYELYKPLCQLSVGLILLVLVFKSWGK